MDRPYGVKLSVSWTQSNITILQALGLNHRDNQVCGFSKSSAPTSLRAWALGAAEASSEGEPRHLLLTWRKPPSGLGTGPSISPLSKSPLHVHTEWVVGTRVRISVIKG